MNLVKWIPKVLKTRKVSVVAAWQEPCGEWGLMDTKTGVSTYGGRMMSQVVILENKSGQLETHHRWAEEITPAKQLGA